MKNKEPKIENIDDYDFIDENFMDRVTSSITTNSEIYEAIDKRLNDYEKEMFSDYYGLYGKQPNSYRGLESKYNLSHETIRRKVYRSLRKIRNYICDKNGGFMKADELIDPEYQSNNYYYQKKSSATYDDGYDNNMKDYEGYTEEEYEDRGIGYR